MYKKHVSKLDGSVTFFSIDGDFWFSESNPEYDNYLAWIAEENEAEEI